jgi:putative oligomerization/nucleic acid binding protein
MGLLGDAIKARRMKDPVDGIAQVVGSTQPPDSATSGNVNMNLVVQAEGVEATSVEHSCLAPTKKWPYPGETLPVTFDRTDPSRLKVRWDDMPDSADVAKQQADAIAAAMNQGGGGAASAGGADVGAIVDALQEAMPGAQINVEGAGAQPTAGSAAGDDHLAQLERLAKLHDTGALTDEEFEREKARILGSS